MKIAKFIIVSLLINLSACYRDGEFGSPFSEEKKTDGKVCAALYLYCDSQLAQCTQNTIDKQTCARPYQDCNNTVRACISGL